MGIQGRASILVVEDNVVVRRMAAALATRLGHESALASHGAEALARLERERFDLVLMDCQMPVMDGLEATRRLRAQEIGRGLPRLPVVAMSADAEPSDRARCLEAGMDDLVAKPITAPVLTAVVDRFVFGTPPPELAPGLPGTLTPGLATIDPETLLQLVPDIEDPGEESLQFVHLFIEQVSLHVEGIRQALSRDDRPGIAQIAHALRGSAATMGANRLAARATAMERAARSAGPSVEPSLAALFSALERDAGHARRALAGRLAAGSST